MSPSPAKATLASLLLVLAAAAPFQAPAKSTDRNQTLVVDADRNDCTLDESGPCIVSGNVHIVQGTLDIQAARADIRQSGGEPRQVKLTGSPVRMKQEMDAGGTMNATAGQIDYDLQADTVIFTGKAVVQQPGRGSIAGERIVYNMRTGQVQGGGEGGGRVRLQFEPRNKTTPPAANPGNGS